MKSVFRFSMIILSLLICNNATSQQQIKKTFQGTHHMLSVDELKKMDKPLKSFTPTAAPSAPVRNIAEFERMEGVLISYPSGFQIPLGLIAEMSQDVVVTTILENSAYMSSIINSFVSSGVDTSNCNFLIAPVNSQWTRDYSGWFVVDSSNTVALIDFPYNRPWRPKDDDVPVYEATFLGLDLYGMDLIHTGGNYMTDGYGISASSTLLLTENPSLNQADIDQLVQDYLGVNTYYLLDDPLDLYIEHIDCWGKFLDVDKILIAEVPVSDYRYNDYETLANFFANTNCSYGYNYQVYRVYSPNGQPYTNSLILNDKVLVPIVNGTGSNWNDSAIAVYERAMPGYEVIGFPYNGWETTDALHCRAHGIADRGMLHIHHFPIYGLQPQQTTYEIIADIISYCDSTIYSDSAMVLYSIDGSPWDTSMMIFQGGDTYKGQIPGPPGGSEVAYFIHAADNSGRSENHPFIGAPDPHIFQVETASSIADKRDEPIKLIIYPNPATDIIRLMMILDSDENICLDIYNSTGSLVMSFDDTYYAKGVNIKEMNISGMSPGVYVLSARFGETIINRKFLVVNR